MQVSISEKDIGKFGFLNISCNNGVVTFDFGSEMKHEPLDIGFVAPMALPMKDLNHLSWDKIEDIGRSGKARETFALGAQKKDYMKNGFVAVWQIIGFDHDDLADGFGKAPISWDLVTVYKERWKMNDTYTNEGGWEKCEMNRRLNGEFVDLCSDDMQAIIKPVVKLTSAGGRSKEIIKSVCKMWLKSEKELYGRCFYSVPGEGNWYEFYKQEDVPYYKEDCNGERTAQFLRSPYYNGSLHFCNVYSAGDLGAYYADRSLGLAPAFSC